MTGPVRTTELAARSSKVRVEDFGRPHEPGGSFAGWLAALPRFLAARDLLEVAERIAGAARTGKLVLAGLGAHVIKVGLAPVINDLMERGVVRGLALNGAGLIHDYEIARAGHTSEDVDATLGDGSFGMTSDTAAFLNEAAAWGARSGLGLGEAVVARVGEARLPHADRSLLATAHRLGVPVTVHVAIGTDVIHLHPSADGAAIGATSLRDFQRFAALVERLEGGVYLNVGSAVLLPEVFLKAVTLARNHGIALGDLTTADFDFRAHYRPLTNVVRRPTQPAGRGFHVTGHHELSIPLLAAAVVEALARPG